MRFLLLYILCLLISSCDRNLGVITLVPEYLDPLDFSEIKTLDPQPVVNQGSVLLLGDFLFVNEKRKGIHVIDNTVPGNPNYLYFWNIPGNSTFTIEGDNLFADNGPHMLVINVSNFGNIKFERYIEGIFYENMLEQFPELAPSGQYFVCPVPEKGLVVSWREEYIDNPNCERI